MCSTQGDVVFWEVDGLTAEWSAGKSAHFGIYLDTESMQKNGRKPFWHACHFVKSLWQDSCGPFVWSLVFAASAQKIALRRCTQELQ